MLFQLRDLLTRSIESWVNLFDESNKNHLPLLRMELIYEDNKMTFYPFFHDLEELILFVVQHLSQRLQSVCCTLLYLIIVVVDTKISKSFS